MIQGGRLEEPFAGGFLHLGEDVLPACYEVVEDDGVLGVAVSVVVVVEDAGETLDGVHI